MRPSDSSDSELFSDAVIEVLAESQRLGFLGERSVREAAQHSRAFGVALSGVDGRVIDIGAGGGLPGLVVAHDRPDLALLLVDRRGKRTDFLRRMVNRLGWGDHVAVREADVRDVISGLTDPFDAVIARGFGPPSVTLTFAADLIGPRGRVVISEPPVGDRWDPQLLQDLGLRRVEHQDSRVVVFERAPS